MRVEDPNLVSRILEESLNEMKKDRVKISEVYFKNKWLTPFLNKDPNFVDSWINEIALLNNNEVDIVNIDGEVVAVMPAMRGSIDVSGKDGYFNSRKAKLADVISDSENLLKSNRPNASLELLMQIKDPLEQKFNVSDKYVKLIGLLNYFKVDIEKYFPHLKGINLEKTQEQPQQPLAETQGEIIEDDW